MILPFIKQIFPNPWQWSIALRFMNAKDSEIMDDFICLCSTSPVSTMFQYELQEDAFLFELLAWDTDNKKQTYSLVNSDDIAIIRTEKGTLLNFTFNPHTFEFHEVKLTDK